jgi:Ni/Co efflux regulator RcnB
MNHQKFVKALIAAAFIALPSAALAQQAPPPGAYSYPHERDFNWQQQHPREWQAERDRVDHERIEADRIARLNWDRDHRGVPYPYTNGYYNNGAYYGNGAYNGGGNYYGNGGYNQAGRRGEITGVVSSFSPFNLYLDRGTHVELHQGTVINPTGLNLNPGERVTVYGNWNGDGSFNADTINLDGNTRRF